MKPGRHHGERSVGRRAARATGLARAILAERHPRAVVGRTGWCLAAGLGLAWGGALAAGDPQRGLEWLRQRHETGCVLCHVVPGLPRGGEIGPPLLGLGARYSAQELTERIADARRFNPYTVMPPYRSIEGLHNVAAAYRGRPVLTEAMLQDIVSHLLSGQAAPAGRGDTVGPATAPLGVGRPGQGVPR